MDLDASDLSIGMTLPEVLAAATRQGAHLHVAPAGGGRLCLAGATLAKAEAARAMARRRWRADTRPSRCSPCRVQAGAESRGGAAGEQRVALPSPVSRPSAFRGAFCGRERHRQPLVSRGPAPVESKGGGGRRIGGRPGAGLVR